MCRFFARGPHGIHEPPTMALHGFLVGLHLPSSCACGPHEEYASVSIFRDTALWWQPSSRAAPGALSARATPGTLSALTPRLPVVGAPRSCRPEMWADQAPAPPNWLVRAFQLFPPRSQVRILPKLESFVCTRLCLRAPVSEISRVLVFLGPVLVVSQHFSN